VQGEASASVDLAADPETVFAAVSDWERQGQWIPLTRVRVVDGPPGLGQRVVARTAVGRIGFDDSMTVTWWDPPHRCEVLHTGRVVRGTGVFLVEPVDGGSRFTWQERVLVPGGSLARLVWPAARVVTRACLALAQRRLARQLEDG
jgi:uncharacterized protein YndB with AHSA1/START domain